MSDDLLLETPRVVRHAVSSLLVVALVVGAEVGCGSPAHVLSGTGATSGAGAGGRGGAAGTGAVAGGRGGFGGTMVAPGGTTGSGGTSGGNGGTRGCPEAVMSYCGGKSDGICTLTWAAVIAEPGLCSPGSGTDDFRGPCGAYDVRELFVGVGGVLAAAYDVTVGNLVAIWTSASGGAGSCVAGPTDFMPPSCDTSVLTKVPCPDGGVDGPDATTD